jgi:hypothetical protein
VIQRPSLRRTQAAIWEGIRSRLARLTAVRLVEFGMNAALRATLPTAGGLPLVVGCLASLGIPDSTRDSSNEARDPSLRSG